MQRSRSMTCFFVMTRVVDCTYNRNSAFERIRKMLDLDKIPKKTLRKWLTVLMLF